MPTINGIKYACEPCMRGHRSSKCSHSDRILIQVRKPGRPLSTCPHPSGHCNCDGLKVAIPKASSCACGDNASSNNTPSPQTTARAGNDQKRVRGSISTNDSTSAHRVRKHGRKESSGISESLVRVINGIEPKELRELQNARSLPQSSDGATDGNKPAAVLTPGTQSQESLQTSPSSHRQSETPDRPTISSRLPSGVTSQADLSPAPLAHIENGGLDHPEFGSDMGGIHQPQNGLPSQEAGFGGSREVNRRYSTTSIQGAHSVPGAIQLPSIQQEKVCTCGANTNQSPASRFDIPDSAYSGLPHGGKQGQPASAEQQQAKTTAPMNSFPAQPQPIHSYSNLPVATTPHAIPQRCSAFQQTLTPEELAFLRKNPGFLSRAVSHLASGAMSGANLSGPYNNIRHNCTCGDTCNCLGCITHPYNPKTLNFVQSVQDLMTTEDQFEGQHARRLSLQGQPVQDMAATISSMSMPVGNGTMDIRNGSNRLQTQGGISQPFTAVQSPVPVSTFGSMSGQVFATSGEMQDQFPLSPTAFYHVDYPIGSCGVGGNNCFCGDGCACPGCTVHSRNSGLVNGQGSANTTAELDATLGSISWADQQQLFSMSANGP